MDSGRRHSTSADWPKLSSTSTRSTRGSRSIRAASRRRSWPAMWSARSSAVVLAIGSRTHSSLGKLHDRSR
jgi:hypothetical protein